MLAPNVFYLNSPKLHLKVPIGAHKIAVENDLETEFNFYYAIKGIRIDGFFKRGKVIHQIQSHLNISESTIRKNLKRLKECGFVKGKSGNYQLISYDSLWDILGIERRNKNPKRFKSKIIKCKTSNFKNELQAQEIKQSISNQKYRLIKKHYKRLTKKDSESVVNTKLLSKLERDLEGSIDLFRKWQTSYLRNKLDYPLLNYEVTLTCQAVAELLGYSHWQKGREIEQRLEKAKLLNVTRRKPIYLCDNNVQAVLINPNITDSCFTSPCEQYIYKCLPNLLSVNDL